MLTLLLAPFGCAPAEPAPTELTDAFTDASKTWDVPYEVLVATSYAVSRFDQRFGEVNREGGIGVMNMRDGADFPSIDAAAALLGHDRQHLVDSATWSIQGAAALLHFEAMEYQELTGEPVDTLEEWYPLVAAWSGATDPVVAEGFAEQVYNTIQWGLAAEGPNGEIVELAPTPLPWRNNWVATTGSSLVYQFIPACSSNYSNYSRGTSDVKYVVIHTTEGSYSGAISWFQNCSANVSAHYTVRSSDGQITQSVDEQDVGWHAGNWDYNLKSIGIEHEGYVSQPDLWYTDAMYRSSADLTRDICDRYGIPKDRSHIIGHVEVPSATHTDPGTGWDWDYYMSLVLEQGSGSSSLGGGGTSDGARNGSFSARITADRYNETDTCGGSITGAVSGGQLYLTGTCTLANNPDASGNMPVTWTGSILGTAIEGKMVVDGHQAEFTGAVNADGSVTASFNGSEDVGGDVGVVDFEVTFSASL